jgi:hypothetical protein
MENKSDLKVIGSASFESEKDLSSKSTSFSVDFTQAQYQKVTLTGSGSITITLNTSGLGVGMYHLNIINSGTATVTFATDSGSILWFNSTLPTLTASGDDELVAKWNGTNWKAQLGTNFGVPS